jgi:hypothetical protein
MAVYVSLLFESVILHLTIVQFFFYALLLGHTDSVNVRCFVFTIQVNEIFMTAMKEYVYAYFIHDTSSALKHTHTSKDNVPYFKHYFQLG